MDKKIILLTTILIFVTTITILSNETMVARKFHISIGDFMSENYHVDGGAIRIPGGTYIISGYTDSYGSGSNDVLFARVDENGAFDWAMAFNGASSEGVGYITATPDSGYVIACGSDSWGTGNTDILVANFKLEHTVQWATICGTALYSETVHSVDIAPDRTIYVGAQVFEPYMGSITKFDRLGNHIWTRIIAPDTTRTLPHSDYYNSLCATADSGCVMLGWSWSYRIGDGNRHLIAVKMTNDGNIGWAKVYGRVGLGVDGGGVCQTNDGGYAVVGDYGSGRPFILRLDSSGGLLWARAFTNGGFFNDVIEDADGDYLMVGTSLDFHPLSRLTRWIVKLDEMGDVVWSLSDIEEPQAWDWCHARYVRELPDGYLVSGMTDKHTDTYAKPNLSLEKIGFDGSSCICDPVIVSVFDFADSIEINDITADVARFMRTPVVSSEPVALVPVPITPNYETDCADIVNISEISHTPNELLLDAYPNPFNDAVAIRFRGVGASEARGAQVGVKIYDILGNLVADLRVANDAFTSFAPTPLVWTPEKSLGSGVYLARATVGEKTVIKRVIYMK